MEKSAIGLIGLAVMGENLALNMERNGFQVSVYNRTHGEECSVVCNFMGGRGKGKKFLGFTTILEFVESLESPRKIFMMVRAGSPVDELMEQLLPHLSPGDIVMDGGNSNYLETNRRVEYAQSKGILYVGAGVSGGEEGALNGPAIMPGGASQAWPLIQPILQKIAAKAEDHLPCCQWIGEGGSGHFVKMVHNGIEYGDMQLIAEAYHLMRVQLGMENAEIAKQFACWNEGKLKSYLIEITAAILSHKEPSGDYLLDKIVDAAGQKGTGKWSVISAMEFGQPLTLIATALFERNLSAYKSLRVAAAETYPKASVQQVDNDSRQLALKQLEETLYASKLVSYAQGFELIRKASIELGWGLNLSVIAKLWRGGCIIRSQFLNSIAAAFEANPALENLLLAPYFVAEITQAKSAWKQTLVEATKAEIAIPAFSSALQYLYALTTERSPANLIQAQRDYFGAHTFERIDHKRGEFFHENWSGVGGNTKSGSYNA
ncbi:MAG: decarboxylating NADP(+)-dependent phosphogluconate dehydrogenase [Phocaeicola sp.]